VIDEFEPGRQGPELLPEAGNTRKPADEVERHIAGNPHELAGRSTPDDLARRALTIRNACQPKIDEKQGSGNYRFLSMASHESSPSRRLAFGMTEYSVARR
jgi:hypothetical protein